MGQVIHGNCLDVLKTLPKNSIDSICCDPPYELGFMGKSWDNTGIAYNKDMWAECLRVLKPGGHLLAFSGTRTYHRMAVAIEDAGFEVRDMVEWVYGCLSEDTEVLTEKGFRRLHKTTQNDRILVYDIKENIYKWEKPTRWSVYKVNEDTAFRIQSDYTDQIVSRNHRCLVEREGKLVFVQAEECSSVENMPTLPDNFYRLYQVSQGILFSPMQRLLSWAGLEEVGKDRRREVKSKSKIKGNIRREKPSVEGWGDLLQEARKLLADKVCSLSERISANGSERRLCNGASTHNGSIIGSLFRTSGGSPSHKSQPTRQPIRELDVISEQQRTQTPRVAEATITPIKYTGIIFCPTVSTGAFVARRNGKIFITGNSGFPKSLNIGKAVDKIQGNEREEADYIGPDGKKRWGGNTFSVGQPPDGRGVNKKSKGTSPWEGWGTALKPAHEPICLARKPLEKGLNVAQNVLKYGTGGLNIDKSRVGTGTGETVEYKVSDMRGGNYGQDKEAYADRDKLTRTRVDTGRFPANFILSWPEDTYKLNTDDEEVTEKVNRWLNENC